MVQLVVMACAHGTCPLTNGGFVVVLSHWLIGPSFIVGQVVGGGGGGVEG